VAFVEFTIEPFVPGEPGPHVLAAVDVAAVFGTVEMGPFGTRVDLSDPAQAGACAAAVISASLSAGATRVAVTAEP
jgi:hypothetical protein